MNSDWTHARVLSSEGDLSQLSKMLRNSGKHLAEVYFPPAESMGEGPVGFAFNFTDCRLRSWDFVGKWCELIRMGPDAPQTVDATFQVHSLKEVASSTRLADSAERLGIPCHWMFLVSKGRPSTTTTNFRFGLWLNEFREPPLQVSIDTPIDAPKSLFPWIRNFWEQASSSLSFLQGGRIVLTGDDGDRPLLEVDDPGYHHVPRKSYNPTGIAINRDKVSNAAGVLRELMAFIESMGPDLTLTWELTTVRLDEQAFQQQTAAMYEVAESFEFEFRGNYREDFSPERLTGAFPPEGYWRLPLVGFGPDEDKAIVRADAIRTPSENFLEFTADSIEDLQECLGGSPLAKQLEVWEGPPHLRWGLDRLAQR